VQAYYVGQGAEPLVRGSGGESAFSIHDAESFLTFVCRMEQRNQPHCFIFRIVQICKRESAQSSKRLKERSNISVRSGATCYVYGNTSFPHKNIYGNGVLTRSHFTTPRLFVNEAPSRNAKFSMRNRIPNRRWLTAQCTARKSGVASYGASATDPEFGSGYWRLHMAEPIGGV